MPLHVALVAGISQLEVEEVCVYAITLLPSDVLVNRFRCVQGVLLYHSWSKVGHNVFYFCNCPHLYFASRVPLVDRSIVYVCTL